MRRTTFLKLILVQFIQNSVFFNLTESPLNTSEDRV